MSRYTVLGRRLLGVCPASGGRYFEAWKPFWYADTVTEAEKTLTDLVKESQYRHHEFVLAETPQ